MRMVVHVCVTSVAPEVTSIGLLHCRESPLDSIVVIEVVEAVFPASRGLSLIGSRNSARRLRGRRSRADGGRLSGFQRGGALRMDESIQATIAVVRGRGRRQWLVEGRFQEAGR